MIEMNQQKIKIKKKYLFLVLTFFLLLNFATSGGHLISIDDVQYFLHTENIALNQSLEINPNSPSASVLIDDEQFKEYQKNIIITKIGNGHKAPH